MIPDIDTHVSRAKSN